MFREIKRRSLGTNHHSLCLSSSRADCGRNRTKQTWTLSPAFKNVAPRLIHKVALWKERSSIHLKSTAGRVAVAKKRSNVITKNLLPGVRQLSTLRVVCSFPCLFIITFRIPVGCGPAFQLHKSEHTATHPFLDHCSLLLLTLALRITIIIITK